MDLNVLHKDLQIYKVIRYVVSEQSRYLFKFKFNYFYTHHAYINSRLVEHAVGYYWTTLTNTTIYAMQRVDDQHNDGTKE